jgi:hypothetical protein
MSNSLGTNFYLDFKNAATAQAILRLITATSILMELFSAWIQPMYNSMPHFKVIPNNGMDC